MCGPMATFIVGAMTSILEFAAADQQAKAAQEAATQAYTQDLNQLSLRQMQEGEATAQKLVIENIKEAKTRAEVEVSAAESGVSGVSLANLLADVTRQASNNRTTERMNERMVVQQLQLEKKGSKASNQSRINQNPRPSPLSLVAGIAGAGVKAMNQAANQMV